MARLAVVKSTPALSPLEFDSHGDHAALFDASPDWWKASVAKWYPSFEGKASNVTVTEVGPNPRDASEVLYVVSFMFARPGKNPAAPEVVLVSRKIVNTAPNVKPRRVALKDGVYAECFDRNGRPITVFIPNK